MINRLPESLCEIQKIFFIAEDATGPFRRVVQIVFPDGRIASFEEREQWDLLIRWLYDQDVKMATFLEFLLYEKEQRTVEILIFKNEQQR